MTYLTLQQAAELLQCNVKTVRRRIADGALPAYRMGEGARARIRLVEEDVRGLLKPLPTYQA